MIEQLFGSKTRVKLLYLFFGNPNRPFYVREITRKIDEQINSVRRELANLLSIGIIVSDTANNKLYYEVNQKYEYYGPLVKIFGADGTAAQAEDNQAVDKGTAPKKFWQGVGNIDLLVYTGHFTRDDNSGVDIVVVGDVIASKLETAVAELEKQEGVELRYVDMALKECEYRRQVNDRFWAQIEAAKKQIIIDKEKIFSP